jgi:AraC-like DNA-binding protein
MNKPQVVAAIVAEGLPRSVLDDVTRLCGAEILVELPETRLSPLPCLATISTRSASEFHPAPYMSGKGTRVSVESTEAGVLAHVFDLTNPRARLALLAWLASRVSSRRRAAEPSSRRAVEPPHWLRTALHVQVAQVQLGLNLHLTETWLAERLAISSSTVRRWFAVEGATHPRRFLLAMRGYAVAQVLGKSSIASVAEELQFEHADSLRRSLARLGTTISRLRTRRGVDEFTTDLQAEIYGRR